MWGSPIIGQLFCHRKGVLQFFLRRPINRVMRLADYLSSRGESSGQFAVRAGLVRQTVDYIVGGGKPRIDIAYAIVRASRDEPAPDGGTVTYEDLLPPDFLECR